MRWTKQPTSRIVTNHQRSIFDQAERKKQQGMNASYDNTSSVWKDAAGEALITTAEIYYEFTTDEVQQVMAKLGIHTGENRAWGAVMQAGRRSGVIASTGQYRQTSQVQAHKRPKAIWRSKIYKDHNA